MTAAEQALLAAVDRAHVASCARENVSKLVFQYASFGSGQYVNGIIAALASLGGPHGPIEETAHFLERGVRKTEGGKVPGWGNSFIKGQKDPLWLEVDDLLKEHFPLAWEKLETITEELQAAGKNIYPNPSAYTATAALIVGLPPKAAAYLFLRGRLDGWTQLYLQS